MIAYNIGTVAKALAGLSIAAVLAGCNPTTTPAANSVTSVTVTPTAKSLNVGDSTTLSLNVVTKGTISKAVTWTSSAMNIATVDSTGTVKAIAPGTTVITATSTADKTKAGKSTITVNAVSGGGGGGGTTPFTTVKINFQAAAFTVPAGFVANSGAAFDNTSGWVTQDSANTATPKPLDIQLNTRTRATAKVAAENNSYILMQFPGNTGPTGVADKAAFEYQVPNGNYNVTVSAGDSDPTVTDSTHVINVEGMPAITAFKPDATTQIMTKKVNVTVADGLLTVDAIGGTNTKLDYLIIEQGN